MMHCATGRMLFCDRPGVGLIDTRSLSLEWKGMKVAAGGEAYQTPDKVLAGRPKESDALTLTLLVQSLNPAC